MTRLPARSSRSSALHGNLTSSATDGSCTNHHRRISHPPLYRRMNGRLVRHVHHEPGWKNRPYRVAETMLGAAEREIARKAGVSNIILQPDLQFSHTSTSNQYTFVAL